VIVENVNGQDARAGEKPGDARCAFTGAATGIENGRIRRQPIALEQRDFLRPDRSRLSVQVPHHGFIGHLPGLRVKVHEFR
jgi:hypothetical protein